MRTPVRVLLLLDVLIDSILNSLRGSGMVLLLGWRLNMMILTRLLLMQIDNTVMLLVVWYW